MDNRTHDDRFACIRRALASMYPHLTSQDLARLTVRVLEVERVQRTEEVLGR